jgi:EcsC protein family
MPSIYENKARKELEARKTSTPGWLDKAMQRMDRPLDAAGGFLMKTPGLGSLIEKSVGGIIGVANDAAQWSVRAEAIFASYRLAGHGNIKTPSDILKLDLEQVDKNVGWLAGKYKALALTEGAGFGAMGPVGIPLDIVSLVTLNLRAIGEYATYYGFDVSLQDERLFAINVLALASSPSEGAKAIAMAQLVQISKSVAKKRAWKDLERYAFAEIIPRLAKVLGIRLTKAKLAQVVPLAGAVVGAGFNAYFTTKVCNAAALLYRERFLAAKYGVDFIDVAIRPANDQESHRAEESPKDSARRPAV